MINIHSQILGRHSTTARRHFGRAYYSLTLLKTADPGLHISSRVLNQTFTPKAIATRSKFLLEICYNSLMIQIIYLQIIFLAGAVYIYPIYLICLTISYYLNQYNKYYFIYKIISSKFVHFTVIVICTFVGYFTFFLPNFPSP